MSSIGRWIKQWRRSWPTRMSSPWIRTLAWLELMLVDHGFLRPFYNRPEEVSPGVLRSNHPSPGMIKALSARGIKTVISLRGKGHNGPYLLEVEACARHGIALDVVRLKSRRPPTKEHIYRLKAAFDQAARPMLFHCKSGADRSGLAAALYLLIYHNDIAAAKAQLSLRYLHVRQSRTGVLDALVDQYAQYAAENKNADFMRWVDEHYDPEKLKRSFKPKGWANWLVDGILRRE